MKINIIHQNALKYRQAQRVRLINTIVTFGSLVLFGLSVLWVTGQYVYYSIRSSALTAEVSGLKSLYSARTEDVGSYLAVKQIVGEVARIQASRFRYKDFLDAVFALLPPAAKLSEVTFGARGIIIVGVRLSNLLEYDVLVNNLKTASAKEDFLFDNVAEKNLFREKEGGYLVAMELTIK